MIDLPLAPQNLARLAALNGFGSVEDLAGQLGRNRVSLYSALGQPHRYKPTVRALDQALPFRQVRTTRQKKETTK